MHYWPTGHTCGIAGMQLDNKLPLKDAVSAIKTHLGMEKVRLAVGCGCEDTHQATVSSVAVCAGSGGSVLNTPLGRKAGMITRFTKTPNDVSWV